MKIPEFKDVVFSADCISHPVMKVVTKFCNHSRESSIRNVFNPQSLGFSQVSVDDVPNQINKLGNRKAIQSTQIPVKILKQNGDVFGSYLCHFFNVCFDKSTFPSALKMLTLHLSL